ncbi:MAG: hypothetical protein ABIC40_02540 [bacterium]
MKKAVPVKFNPSNLNNPIERELWMKKIDSFDRGVRRSNFRFKIHVLRLNNIQVGLIDTNRKLPLDRLNDLDPVNRPEKADGLDESMSRGVSGYVLIREKAS